MEFKRGDIVIFIGSKDRSVTKISTEFSIGSYYTVGGKYFNGHHFATDLGIERDNNNIENGWKKEYFITASLSPLEKVIYNL